METFKSNDFKNKDDSNINFLDQILQIEYVESPYKKSENLKINEKQL